MRAVEAWAVKHWTGSIYADTIRRTRNEAIAAFMDLYQFDHKKWDADRRCRVHMPIRVYVMPITPVKPR